MACRFRVWGSSFRKSGKVLFRLPEELIQFTRKAVRTKIGRLLNGRHFAGAVRGNVRGKHKASSLSGSQSGRAHSILARSQYRAGKTPRFYGSNAARAIVGVSARGTRAAGRSMPCRRGLPAPRGSRGAANLRTAAKDSPRVRNCDYRSVFFLPRFFRNDCKKVVGIFFAVTGFSGRIENTSGTAIPGPFMGAALRSAFSQARGLNIPARRKCGKKSPAAAQLFVTFPYHNLFPEIRRKNFI